MQAQAIAAGLAADPKALSDLRRRAARDEEGALREAAKQFETVLLDIAMKNMRATVPGDGAMDSEATRMFTSLLDQQFVQGVAKQGGLGLAEVMVKQLSHLRGAHGQEKAAAADSRAGEAQ